LLSQAETEYVKKRNIFAKWDNKNLFLTDFKVNDTRQPNSDSPCQIAKPCMGEYHREQYVAFKTNDEAIFVQHLAYKLFVAFFN
jgi:hypothetical protein